MATSPRRWANRIVRHADVDPRTLSANPANWRVHPKAQADALAGVLSEIGVVQSVIVNERSGRIVDGHLRVQLAVERGEPTIPVGYVDLADGEERLVLATLDPLSAMAETDADALRDLLGSVTADDDVVQRLVQFIATDRGLEAPDDPMAEWAGMPGFEHEDMTAGAAFTIRVYLQDGDELAAFGRLMGQDLTGRTFVWFGKHPRGTLYEVAEETVETVDEP
jgi:hypothetical protein